MLCFKSNLRRTAIQTSRAKLLQPRSLSASTFAMSRLSDAIIKDHRELDRYYNVMVTADDPGERTRYQNQFVWELARHSLGEEIVVYPLFEEKLAGGREMAQKDREEHQKVGIFLPKLFTYLIFITI